MKRRTCKRGEKVKEGIIGKAGMVEKREKKGRSGRKI